MQSVKDEEFEILGLKLKFTPETDVDNQLGVGASEVVEYIQSEIIEIQKQSKRHLDPLQVAILVALKIGRENLETKKDFSMKLGQLEKTAKDALTYLNDVSPHAQ
jgi:hypothetical protein